jgi:hypothetical protein
MALCSHLPSIWPKAMCKEARREIVLMYLEKNEMVLGLPLPDPHGTRLMRVTLRRCFISDPSE